jgi:hypothetical protein
VAATATKIDKPTAPARPTTWDLELGVPATPVPVVIQVEAKTAAEAMDILTDLFRRGLRVVGRP